ncbi:hypothetical protein FHG87_015029 [Trinorchestia longiramus]|nr:hypothetical protein FHG87_015029 [Trinorchestia longiramus]
MDKANSVATPVDLNADLVTTSNEVEECDKDLCQSAVGSFCTKEIDLVYCPSNDMLADKFTKGVSAEKFSRLRRKLGVVFFEKHIQYHCFNKPSFQRPHHLSYGTRLSPGQILPTCGFDCGGKDKATLAAVSLIKTLKLLASREYRKKWASAERVAYTQRVGGRRFPNFSEF